MLVRGISTSLAFRFWRVQRPLLLRIKICAIPDEGLGRTECRATRHLLRQAHRPFHASAAETRQRQHRPLSQGAGETGHTLILLSPRMRHMLAISGEQFIAAYT